MRHLQPYNTFILEYSNGSRTEKLDMDELVRIFNEKCSDWDLESNKQIYRGSYTSHQMFYVNSIKHEYRYSANTEGFYQALLPHLKSWRNAPIRSKSLIMVTDYSTATQFGDDNVFLMIPFNGVEIGMCPCSDLWCSVDYMKEITGDDDITWEEIDDEFIDFIRENASSKYVEYYNTHPYKDHSKKAKRFKRGVLKNNIIDIINDINNIPREELKTNWSYSYEETEPHRIINNWLVDHAELTLLEFIEMFFDFRKNGFKIIDKQSELELGKEVWSSGEFIGLHINHEKEFKEKIKISRNSNQSNNQN